MSQFILSKNGAIVQADGKPAQRPMLESWVNHPSNPFGLKTLSTASYSGTLYYGTLENQGQMEIIISATREHFIFHLVNSDGDPVYLEWERIEYIAFDQDESMKGTEEFVLVLKMVAAIPLDLERIIGAHRKVVIKPLTSARLFADELMFNGFIRPLIKRKASSGKNVVKKMRQWVSNKMGDQDTQHRRSWPPHYYVIRHYYVSSKVVYEAGKY